MTKMGAEKSIFLEFQTTAGKIAHKTMKHFGYVLIRVIHFEEQSSI